MNTNGARADLERKEEAARPELPKNPFRTATDCQLGRGAGDALYLEELTVLGQRPALLWLQAWSEPGMRLWYRGLMSCHVPAMPW